MGDRLTTTTWRGVMQDLLANGDEVSPESLGANWRGRTNRELLGYQTRVPMDSPVVLCPGRKLGYRFMAAEAAAILSGDNSLATIRPFAKQMDKLSEDGLTMTGHYGPPFRDQVSYVLAALRKDPSSRQAVCVLWRPRPALGGEIPCTLTLQWIVRLGRMHCFVNMRSSDAWMGLPYDLFAFSMMSAYLAIALRGDGCEFELGDLTVTAGSQHLFKIDWPSAGECIARDDEVCSLAPLNLAEFDQPDQLIDHLWAFARREYVPGVGGPFARNWLSDLDASLR
jgi:thymidylate synthase